MQTDSVGFFETVQRKIDSFFSSCNISSRDMMTYITCFGVGFAVGLLFRRYGKWVVGIALGVIGVLTVLHYFEFITVHQATIKCMLGLYDVHSVADLINFIPEKIQLYWIEVVILIISFLIGFKLG